MIIVNEHMLGAYDDQRKIANDSLVKLYEYHQQINEILSSGNWEGKIHDGCVNVVAGVNDYLTTLKTDFNTLNKDVLELIEDTDAFVNKAASVQQLQE